MKKQDEAMMATVKQSIEVISKGLGVAATELWTIFVRQSVVRGLSELFTAIILFTGAYFIQPYVGLWCLVPVAVAIILVYGAINLLGNPKYYALEDLSKKINEIRNNDSYRL